MASIAGIGRGTLGGLFSLIVVLLATHADAASKITVYTAFETEQLAPYKQAFEKAHPDIEIQ